MRPAPNPCGSCPYRRDVPSGVWAAHEYEKLKGYDAETPYQPPGIFQCHQSSGPDSDQARLCAGWVGCHGNGLLALRLAASFGAMDPEELIATLEYETKVPLFNSGAEAAEHGERDIECPSDKAARVIDKVIARRDDVTIEGKRK